MSFADREQLVLMLEEASALPPSSPLRQEVQDRLTGEEDWLRSTWEELLQENATLQRVLQDVPVPFELEAQLLAIPEATRTRRRFPIAQLGVLVGAALLLLALGVGWWHNRVRANRLETVALLAINDHLNDHVLEVETENPSELERALADQIPFETIVPDLGEKFRLLGGRKCVLGTHPVVFSSWQGPNGEYTLIQFQPHDFGLSANIPTTIVSSEVPAGTQHRCGVLIWTEGTYGYVLVSDTRHGLERVSPKPREP